VIRPASFGLEQRLQVIPQSDSDNRKTGTDREHGKQGDEILDPNPTFGHAGRGGHVGGKIKGVEVLQIVERVHGRHTHESVEEQNQSVIDDEERRNLSLVLDGRDERG